MADKEELKKIGEEVVEKLKEVYDPEIPVNIYDLGLIYDVKVTAEKEVVILMTLTAPNCPVAGEMPQMVENAAKSAEGVENAKAILTFDPPWDQDMMSEEAQLELGLL